VILRASQNNALRKREDYKQLKAEMAREKGKHGMQESFVTNMRIP
jgi:hypothetical protein